MSKHDKKQDISKDKLELLARALILSSKKNKKAQKKLAKTVRKLGTERELNCNIVLEHPRKDERLCLQLDLRPAPTQRAGGSANSLRPLTQSEIREVLKGKNCSCCKKRCPLVSPKCSKGKKARALQIARAEKRLGSGLKAL